MSLLKFANGKLPPHVVEVHGILRVCCSWPQIDCIISGTLVGIAKEGGGGRGSGSSKIVVAGIRLLSMVLSAPPKAKFWGDLGISCDAFQSRGSLSTEKFQPRGSVQA